VLSRRGRAQRHPGVGIRAGISRHLALGVGQFSGSYPAKASEAASA
jgi:hypothetical protein